MCNLRRYLCFQFCSGCWNSASHSKSAKSTSSTVVHLPTISFHSTTSTTYTPPAIPSDASLSLGVVISQSDILYWDTATSSLHCTCPLPCCTHHHTVRYDQEMNISSCPPDNLLLVLGIHPRSDETADSPHLRCTLYVASIMRYTKISQTTIKSTKTLGM